MKNTFFCTIYLAFLSSCMVTYGDNNYSRITKVNEIECVDKAERMYLFFEGEPIDYTYERIGLVEANGNRFTSNDLVMDYLKYEAWNACANAIINIKRDFKTREEGSMLDDEDDTDFYDATVYSGLAVRIDTDTEFISKYGNGLDTSFRQAVANDMNQQIKESNTQATASVVLLVLGIMVAIVTLGNH